MRLLCLVLAGCGRIAFDPLASSGDSSAPDAPCTLGAWSAPVPIPELDNGAPEFDPAQRGDRLQLWNVIPGSLAIHTARRASTSEPFGPLARETFNGNIGNDQDPTPIGDGLAILWSSNR